MRLTTGTYVGNGTSQPVTGAGFAPIMVWVERPGFADGIIEWKIAAMGTRSGNCLFQAFAPNYITTGITSLDADGFTVGSSTRVNAAGVTYRWLAWESDPASIEVGSYVGNGISPRTITTSFAPAFAWVQNDNVGGAGSRVPIGVVGEPNHPTSQDWGGSTDLTQLIRGFSAAPLGFIVGFFPEVNLGAPPGTYYYFCLSSTPPVGTGISVGFYTGNGTSQSITSPGFLPDWVLCDLRSGGGIGARGIYKQIGMGATTSKIPHNAANAGGDVTNGITGFIATGFTLGSNSAANIGGGFYRFVAVQSAPPPAQTIGPLSSIVSAEAFGTPLVKPADQFIGPGSIATGEAFGTIEDIFFGIGEFPSANTGEVFGTVNIAFDQFIDVDSVPSGEAFSDLKCIGVGLAPSIAGTSFGTAGNSTTVSAGGISLGVQPGELMVAWHSTDGVSRILTPPPGWTTLASVTRGDQTAELSYKIAAVGDVGAFFTWTSNISEAQCVRIFRVINSHPIVFIHRLAQIANNPVANPSQAPVVTPSSPNLTIKFWSWSRFVNANGPVEDPNDTFEGRCSAGGTGVNSVEQAYASREYLCPEPTSPSGIQADIAQTGSVVTLSIAGFCALPTDPVICADLPIASAEAFGTPTITRSPALGSGFSPVIVAQKIKIVTTGFQPSPYNVPKPVPADFPPNREGGQGVAVGDLLVVLIATNQNNNFALGPPPGWTLAFNTNMPPSGLTTAGLYKVADAGDVAATSYNFFFTGTAVPESVFLVIRGFDPTAIVHQLAITPLTTPAGNPYNYPVAVSSIPSLVLTILNNPFGYGPVTGPGLQNRFGGPGAGPVAPGGEQYDVGSPAGIANSLTQSFPGADLDDQTGSTFNTNPNSIYAFHSQPAAGTSGALFATLALPGAFTGATTVVWMIGGTAPPQLLCPIAIPSEEVFGLGQSDPLVDPYPIVTNVLPPTPRDTVFFGKNHPEPLDPLFQDDPEAEFSKLEPFTDPVEFVGKEHPEELDPLFGTNPNPGPDPSISGKLIHIHLYMDTPLPGEPFDTLSDKRR